MDACWQGYDLIALKVFLFAVLVPLDEVMEVYGPKSQRLEHTLVVDFAIPGEDGSCGLPEVGLGKAAVEPESAHSVHAVYDSALVHVWSDPEHVLVDHGDGLEDALVELRKIP